MHDLPSGLRRYLRALYALCGTLIAVALWRFMQSHVSLSLATGALVFVILSYVGERTRLQVVSGSNTQTLATTVHVTIVLLFPTPIVVLVTLLGAMISQILHEQSPWYKRAFNISHPTLAAGLTSLAVSLSAAPMPIPRPDHVVSQLPLLLTIILLYYLFDVGTLLPVLTLVQRRSAWMIWREAYRRTLLPELAMSSIGILASVAWQFDHILLALFVIPVVTLGIAFRAIAAEDRAAMLRRRSEQLEAVLQAGHFLRLQHSQVEVLRAVATAAQVIVPLERVEIYLRDDQDATKLRCVAVIPDLPESVPATWTELIPPGSLRSTGPIFEEDGSALRLPLAVMSLGVVGLLRLVGVPRDLPAADQDTLAILVAQATIALENAHLHESALLQAATDGLTGLLNHRSFQGRLQEMIVQSVATGQPLALIMVDLDDFGSINNQYGHQAGDAVLKEIARILQANTRVTDVIARYGGDEFTVIVPGADWPAVLSSAERLSTAINTYHIVESKQVVHLGASLGVAALGRHASSREDLIRAADQAAYAAKHAGKGRVGVPEEAAVYLTRDPALLAMELAHANLATVKALAAAVDAKDPYTHGHAERVSAYAAALAEAMELSAADVERIRLAGLLHDVGKIGIPDAILTKADRLDSDEYDIIKRHPEIGERVLMAVPFLRDVLPGVRHHHERWDGQGYPDGLAGEAIPRDATILLVADTLDAMTTTRTYRRALLPDEALRCIWAGSGTQFAPDVVAALERAVATKKITFPQHSAAEDQSPQAAVAR